jgi:hypothetical protein
MRRTLLILWIVYASVSTSSAARLQRETISGRIVAYSNSLACLNGNGYWSMVIRVQRPKDTRSEFIRVDFSLPCGKSPEWVSSSPSTQKFRLLRQKDCDAALEGSMDEAPGRSLNLALPIWKHPPGTEQDLLPFGQVIPCYRSVELPLAPVL